DPPLLPGAAVEPSPVSDGPDGDDDGTRGGRDEPRHLVRPQSVGADLDGTDAVRRARDLGGRRPGRLLEDRVDDHRSDTGSTSTWIVRAIAFPSKVESARATVSTSRRRPAERARICMRN